MPRQQTFLFGGTEEGIYSIDPTELYPIQKAQKTYTKSFFGESLSQITCISLSTKHDFVVAGGKLYYDNDWGAVEWNIETKQQTLFLRGHTDKLVNVFYWDKGKFIISASKDGQVKIWDAKSGACLSTKKFHSPIAHLQKSEQEGVLLVGTKSCLYFYRLNDRHELRLVNYLGKPSGISAEKLLLNNSFGFLSKPNYQSKVSVSTPAHHYLLKRGAIGTPSSEDVDEVLAARKAGICYEDKEWREKFLQNSKLHPKYDIVRKFIEKHGESANPSGWAQGDLVKALNSYRLAPHTNEHIPSLFHYSTGGYGDLQPDQDATVVLCYDDAPGKHHLHAFLLLETLEKGYYHFRRVEAFMNLQETAKQQAKESGDSLSYSNNGNDP